MYRQRIRASNVMAAGALCFCWAVGGREGITASRYKEMQGVLYIYLLFHDFEQQKHYAGGMSKSKKSSLDLRLDDSLVLYHFEWEKTPRDWVRVGGFWNWIISHTHLFIEVYTRIDPFHRIAFYVTLTITNYIVSAQWKYHLACIYWIHRMQNGII